MDLKKEIKIGDLFPSKLPSLRRKGGGPAPRKAAPKQLVGLKIGATGITAAQVVTNGTRQLVQLVDGALEPGVIDGGEVRDPAALGKALADFFTEHALPRRAVRLGLGNSRIGVRVIEIAGIDDESQLENAIAFRAHEMLSIPPDEAVIDYHVLSADVDDAGVTTRRILLVVAYRESIDRYLSALDQAGIELAGIDLESFALLRAVAEPSADDFEREVAIIAVAIGHERSTLAISDGRTCQFTRVLEWGGANISAAIAHALKLSPTEGEEVKRRLSLADDTVAAGFVPAARAVEAAAAARLELATLVRELLSSLRFYQSQPGSLAIGEILVTGGAIAMPGLVEELERGLGIRLEIADPLLRVELGEGVEPPEQLGPLAIAVGLGIED